jgi:hypothetical protein
MVPNRFAMLLAAIAVSASAAVAKPTLTIIPQRVVYSSLLQHVDVRVHIPANEPAFTGYVTVCDTYNFAVGNRFGTAVSINTGESRVIRIEIPGPRFNTPNYLVELSANRDLSKPVASTGSKADATFELNGLVVVVIGGSEGERDALATRMRNLPIPLNYNAYSNVSTYEPVVKASKTQPGSPARSMAGAPTVNRARILVPRSGQDVNDWASWKFGDALAVVVLPGTVSPDVREALQCYADFGGVVVDSAGLGLRNAHETVITAESRSAAARLASNMDDLARRHVAAQSAIVFMNADTSDRDMRNAPELKSPSIPLIFLLLAVYTLGAIPLLYIVLKRSGKRELAWVALPGVAAGFTGIFGIMGAMNRPTTPFAQHRELIAGTMNSPYFRSLETFSIYNGVEKQVLLDVPSRGATLIGNGSITSNGRVSGFLSVPQWAMATTRVESPTYDLGGSVNLSRLPNGDFTVTNNTNFTLAGASLGRKLQNNIPLGAVLNPGQSVNVARKELEGPGEPGQPSFDVGWGYTLNDQIENGFSDESAVLKGSDYYFKARIVDVPNAIKLDNKPLKVVRSQRMLFMRCSESAISN